LAIPVLDDRILHAILPLKAPELREPHTLYKGIVIILAVFVAYLSINPIRNMLSPRQIMNTTYNPYHIVGTYGAFGSITRTRYEVIVEGTDETVLTQSTKWREYEFRAKPGDPSRAPPQIAPYHLRLDWLMWFAAMSDYYQHPWFLNFMAKLLRGDAATLSLLRTNPFPNQPPRLVRAQLHAYHFTTPDERKKTGLWWNRQFVDTYFPPVSLQ